MHFESHNCDKMLCGQACVHTRICWRSLRTQCPLAGFREGKETGKGGPKERATVLERRRESKGNGTKKEGVGERWERW